MKATAALPSILGAILVASIGASAGEMTAGDLRQICTASGAECKSACRFYILGVTQGIDAGMGIADGKTQGGRPCVPSDTPGVALEFAVKKILGEDLMIFPDDRKIGAAGLVAAAIIKTFPCRRAN